MAKSPNHFNGRNGWKPDMICCHVTEGGFAGSVSWLCNPASVASAHFVIGANGQKEQLVDFKDGSYCNGNSTSSTSRLYYKNSLNPIIQGRATNANYYTYSIEHEGYSYKERFGGLTEAQYQASFDAMKLMITDMKQTYGIDFIPDRNHLIGHYQIDPTGKPSCPAPNKGANFPFDRFLTDIKAWMEKGSPSTPTVQTTPPTTTQPSTPVNSYTVRVDVDALNIRSAPNSGSIIVGVIRDRGIYTIVEEATGTGATKWGKLKSGAGWISLDYIIKQTQATVTPAPSATIGIGSKVNLKSGAKTYTGGVISPFVFNETWIVSGLSGERVVIDKNVSGKNSICTPVNIKDLVLA